MPRNFAMALKIPKINGLPENFQIGLVLGASGSGKTQLVSSLFGNPEEVQIGLCEIWFEAGDLKQCRSSGLQIRPSFLIFLAPRHLNLIPRVLPMKASIGKCQLD